MQEQPEDEKSNFAQDIHTRIHEMRFFGMKLTKSAEGQQIENGKAWFSQFSKDAVARAQWVNNFNKQLEKRRINLQFSYSPDLASEIAVDDTPNIFLVFSITTVPEGWDKAIYMGMLMLKNTGESLMYLYPEETTFTEGQKYRRTDTTELRLCNLEAHVRNIEQRVDEKLEALKQHIDFVSGFIDAKSTASFKRMETKMDDEIADVKKIKIQKYQ